VNGKIYVGSAITARIWLRFHKHLIGFSGSTLIVNAVKKYGLNNFAFVIVETISAVITGENNEQLIAAENKYISALKPMYNIAPIAGNTFGYKHTEETKEKMKEDYSEERRETIGSLNRGNNLSEETIEKIRLKAVARPPMTQETKIKVSQNSAKAIIYQVTRVDGTTLPDGLTSIDLVTINKVADYCNCNEKTVRRALKANGVIKGTFKVIIIGILNPKKIKK